MDYLPIQASAIPSERVFSSSSETMTKRQNRISPVFTKGWMTSMAQMAVDVDDDDVIDHIIGVIGDEEVNVSM
ncbi:hypothetical protein BS17DRAFT_777437 [Gyrodon lividus]|nr:hypothetical protein BS17DRAFT_777437 [Gyrodon lividus]